MRQGVRNALRAGSLAVALGLAITGCAGSSDDNPVPEVSVSDSDGSLVVGEGSTLPATWPADIPAPNGLVLQSVIDSGTTATALYLGRGNAALIGQDVARELTENGYSAQSTTTEGFETTTTYIKGPTTVAVAVSQAGTDAAITYTVARTG